MRSFPSGAPVEIEIQASVFGPASSVTLDVSGNGVLANAGGNWSFSGPWSSTPHETVSLSVPVTGEGDGYLVARAIALGSDGSELYSRLTRLYASSTSGATWVSPSSPTDLHAQRLRSEYAAGAMTREALEAAQAELVTATVTVSHAPVAATPMTPSEATLQRSFESLGAAPAQSQTSMQVGAPPGTAAGTAAYAINGRVLWTDRNGGTHGLPFATVEIWDNDDPLGDELVTTTRTNAAGVYAVAFDHDDGIAQGDPDFYVRVLARSIVADIKPDTGASATTYRMESPVQNEVPPGTLNINFTAGNVNDNETVFSVHHALVMIGGYAGNLAGVMPSTVDTRFPTTRSTSLFDSGLVQLHILQLDRWDWDVTHHEYGHYFQNVHKFQANPGGSHNLGANLSSATFAGSKELGTRLAWGEGWPTFFGIAGQIALGASGLNVPNVGQVIYNDTEDSTLTANLETSVGVGEDDELSVMSSLWDVFDSAADRRDEWSQSDSSMFTLFKNAKVTRMGSAWESLIAGKSPLEKSLLGAILSDHRISPDPLTPPDNVVVPAGTIPTFTWTKNGGGALNPLNDFKVRFYDSSFNAILFEKAVGDVSTWTPTQAEWDMITAQARSKWVILGRSTAAPATSGGAEMYYWSEARTIGGGIQISFVIDDTGSMGEEINAVRSALDLFITLLESLLGPDEPAPIIQLVTFKDSVNERIVSNDLDAVRAAVGSISASGGGGCPEFGAQSIAFAGSSLADNGIILFATDAASQPGVDLSSVVASLQAKNITVHTILSGDCGSLGATYDPSSWLADTELSGSATSIFQSDDPGEGDFSGLGKPGDTDIAQEDIDDVGQAGIDDHGNTLESATALVAGESPIHGRLDSVDLLDVFTLDVEEGKTYSLRYQRTSQAFATFTLAIKDTTGMQIHSVTASNSTPGTIPFVAAETGTLSLEITGFGSSATYSVAYGVDAFAFLTRSLEMFSAISAQTGGAFSVQDDVDFGNTQDYESSMFNIMAGSIRPAVVVASPNDLPLGTTLSVGLSGNNTNWTSGSTLSFEDAEGVPVTGVTLDNLEVVSATQIIAQLTIAEDAPMFFMDAVVTTPIGSAIEVARGFRSFEIVGAPTSSTVLSIQPYTVQQGESVRLTFFGTLTQWDATTTVGLGNDITVNAVNVLSPNSLAVDIDVAPDADISFRTAITTTEAVGTVQQTRAILVSSALSSFPRVNAITPTVIARGRTIDVNVTGEDVNFVDGETTANFGAGTQVLGVRVLDETSAVVTVFVELTAELAFRNVSMTTGSETASLVNGFFVGDFDASMPVPTTGKLSGCLDAYGLFVHEIDVASSGSIQRLFIKPMGSEAEAEFEGPTFLEVHLIHPSGVDELLTVSVNDDAVDLDAIDLPSAGTYRLVLRDHSNRAGCFKAKVRIATD